MQPFTEEFIKAITTNSGVYYLKINENDYVGSSVSLKTRLLEHINKLKNNKHENPRMQNTFNKYGIEKCKFSILANYTAIGKELLLESEKSWIERLDPVLNNKLDPTTQNNSGSQSKKVYQFNMNGMKITSYPSTKEAQRQTSVPSSSIIQNCNGHLLSAGGYLWSYEEDAKVKYDLERSKWKWKAVEMTDLLTGEKSSFDNIAKAARHLYDDESNFDSICASISSICKGKGKKLRNRYTFCYKA